MARARNPDRIKAEEMFLENKGNIELVKIAEILDRPPGTIRGWKNKDAWDDKLNGTFQPDKAERCKRKKGGQPNNKNAVGHGAPKGNKNSEKHGFFSKWLPEETKEIMGAIQSADPLDLLWDNIQLQYTAIIRAQKLMYVKDQKDMTKEITMDAESATAHEVQQAWDKHATFLNAQSRAMGELRSMIKQYDELLHKNWNLATKEQKARIENIKASTNKLTGDNADVEDLSEIYKDIYGDANGDN